MRRARGADGSGLQDCRSRAYDGARPGARLMDAGLTFRSFEASSIELRSPTLRSSEALPIGRPSTRADIKKFRASANWQTLGGAVIVNLAGALDAALANVEKIGRCRLGGFANWRMLVYWCYRAQSRNSG
jgi:hypothetical protein